LGESQKLDFIESISEGFDYVAVLHGDNQAKTQELNFLIEKAKSEPELDVIM
jgi:hypothetical protein